MYTYTIARRVIIAEARSVGDFGMNWQRIRCISRRLTTRLCVCGSSIEGQCRNKFIYGLHYLWKDSQRI